MTKRASLITPVATMIKNTCGATLQMENGIIVAELVLITNKDFAELIGYIENSY